MTIRNRLAGLAAALAVLGAAWCGVSALAQTAPRLPAKASTPGEPAVAVVGGRRITRATFEQRVREAEETYRQRSNESVPTAFRAAMRRQVLEAMIREQLLIQEAKRRGMALTEEQAEQELKKDPFFQSGSTFDEAKFLAVKATQPAQFRNAIETLQSQMPAVRLKQQLERENAPGPELKADLERELSQVTIDFLALRRAAFSSRRPEPSEREILELYRAHASEYPRPEQVVVTMLSVQEPGLSAEDHSNPAAVQTWEARMKERADSLLAALKKGGRLEDLAPTFGVLSAGVVASRNQFPAVWRGSAHAQQALLATSAGRMLEESVPGDNGFLLVRVDQKRPAHTASFAEAAPQIRDRARAEAMERLDRREREAIYAAIKDSLRGPAFKVRYAVADTAIFAVSEPSAAELDRYYRGHLADYSYFDAKTSSVGSRSFAEVRGDVRRRLLQERRVAAARGAAEALMSAWVGGRRDSKLERAMSWMRDVGPVPVDGVVDTGAVGASLSDSLLDRWRVGAGWIKHRRGFVVYHVYTEIKDYTPTFAEALPALDARRDAQRAAEDEAGARRLFEKHPERFRADNVVHFSRLMVNVPDVTKVELSRDEVDRWYKTHPDDYGAPELAHVRHILITPKDTSPKADAEARERAEEVMRKLKAGESFPDLAKAYSDDVATRDKGGDVGVFRHGMMLEDFERVAFSMRPGELRGPVRSEVGYHVIESLEHVPAEVTPLRYSYSSVAADAARDKADRIARFRADSLRRVLKNGAQAARVAKSMQFPVYQNDDIPGKSMRVDALADYFGRVERLKPGQFDDRVQEYRGMGYAVTWVDSITPQRRPTWETVQNQAIEAYRRDRDEAELQKKRADLDSLRHAGWSFDSLTTLFGGAERHGPHGPGSGLERLAGHQLLDSLAFGTAKSPPVLHVGKPTDWVDFPGGLVMMKLVERRGPDPVQLASRLENEQRARLEVKLRKVYDRLKERFPVVIQDPELRLTELPQVPGS